MNCETLRQKLEEIALEETAVRKALATNTVLHEIFRCLSVGELVRLSTLNKTWNYEARCVLRDERKSVASLNGPESCNKAKLFIEQMGRMNVVFYNGLSIEPCSKYCPCVGEENMEDLLGEIMNLPLKFLEINWKGGSCLLGQVASSVLKRSLILEYVNVISIPTGEELWARGNTYGRREERESCLSRLCDHDEEYLENLFQTKIVTEIPSRAVNLEELKFTLDQLFPPDGMKLVESIHCSDVQNQNVVCFMDQVNQAQPKFRCLHLKKPRCILSPNHVIPASTCLWGTMESTVEQNRTLTLGIPIRIEKTYECEFPGCTKSFKLKKNWTQHQNCHYSPQRACKLCETPKYFKERDSLIMHRKIQHEVPTYLCDECEEAYQTSAELNDHRREKHSTCVLCGGHFGNSARRKIHMKACRQMHGDLSSDIGMGQAPSMYKRLKESCLVSHDSGISCGRHCENMSRSMIEESLPEVDESSMETKPNIVTKETTLMSEREDNDEQMAKFGIITASVALATFYTHGVQSIPPRLLDQMLQIGQLYREELGIGPETDHAAAINLINGHGKIENDEPYISVNFCLVEKPVFKGKLDSNLIVLNAFDRFSDQFRWGILNVDGKYVAIELDIHASHDFYVFDPVGNGSLVANKGYRKATIVRCPKSSLGGYLSNVFTGASSNEFTIIPVTMSKIMSAALVQNATCVYDSFRFASGSSTRHMHMLPCRSGPFEVVSDVQFTFAGLEQECIEDRCNLDVMCLPSPGT